MINHMKKSVHDTITWVKDAPLASRQLGFTTGCMLAFGGFVMGIIHFFNLNFVKALLDFAIFFTGGCACAIEYKGMFLYFIHRTNPNIIIYLHIKTKPYFLHSSHHFVSVVSFVLYCIILYVDSFLPSTIKEYFKEDMLFVFRPFGRPLVYMFWGVYIIIQGQDGSITGYEGMVLGALVFCAAIIQIYHTFVSTFLHTHIDIVYMFATVNQLFKLINNHFSLKYFSSIDQINTVGNRTY